MRKIYRKPVHWHNKELLGINIWGILSNASQNDFFSVTFNYSVIYDKIASEGFFSLDLTPLI